VSWPVTTVATPSHVYAVSGREQTLDAVLIIVPLVRAATGQPLPPRAAQPHAVTRHPHARALIVSGGYLVVAGRPDLALRPAPAPSTTITVELAVPGEPVISHHFIIPTSSALPLHLPPWELDDPPLTVTGTVRRSAFPYPAVPSAMVVAGTGAASAPFALALRTPLSLDHAAGRTVRLCTLIPGPATTLAEPARLGALSVVLTSTAGIGAGTVLEIGDETIREHVVADGAGPDPGQVLLRTPIVHSAPAGAAVASSGAAVSGPAPVLTRTARAGDGVLLLDALPPTLVSAAVIQIPDGANSEVRAPHAVSDANGHFRLPGVRNLAALELTATGPVGPGPSVTTAIDPGGVPVIFDLTTP
jgi:hypothetical protein